MNLITLLLILFYCYQYPIDKTALEKGLFFLYNYRGFLPKKDDVKIVGFLSLELLHKNPKARIGI